VLQDFTILAITFAELLNSC